MRGPAEDATVRSSWPSVGPLVFRVCRAHAMSSFTTAAPRVTKCRCNAPPNSAPAPQHTRRDYPGMARLLQLPRVLVDRSRPHATELLGPCFTDRHALSALDSSRVSEILKRVAGDRAYWTVIEVGTEMLSGAEALVSVHPLRTLDAIHVASAQLFAARLSISDLIFVSADKRQTEVASAIALATRHIR